MNLNEMERLINTVKSAKVNWPEHTVSVPRVELEDLVRVAEDLLILARGKNPGYELKDKPTDCQKCQIPAILVDSMKISSYFYCRGCKREVSKDGQPIV